MNADGFENPQVTAINTEKNLKMHCCQQPGALSAMMLTHKKSNSGNSQNACNSPPLSAVGRAKGVQPLDRSHLTPMVIFTTMMLMIYKEVFKIPTTITPTVYGFRLGLCVRI